MQGFVTTVGANVWVFPAGSDVLEVCVTRGAGRCSYRIEFRDGAHYGTMFGGVPALVSCLEAFGVGGALVDTMVREVRA